MARHKSILHASVIVGCVLAGAGISTKQSHAEYIYVPRPGIELKAWLSGCTVPRTEELTDEEVMYATEYPGEWCDDDNESQ